MALSRDQKLAQKYREKHPDYVSASETAHKKEREKEEARKGRRTRSTEPLPERTPESRERARKHKMNVSREGSGVSSKRIPWRHRGGFF